jgi:hypothetical protein
LTRAERIVTLRVMSYAQTFSGQLSFASADAFESALGTLDADGFDYAESFFARDALRLEGLTLRIDEDAYGPAAMWEPSLCVLGTLGDAAVGGAVKCVFIGDGEEVEWFGPDAPEE